MTHNADSLADQPTPTPALTWAQPSALPRVTLVEEIPARTQTRIVVAAGLAGFTAQVLVVEQSIGINLLLWVVLVLGAAWLLRRPTARFDALDLWLPMAAVAFGAFPALRSDHTLLPFDTLAAGALTLASVVAMGGTRLTRRSASGLVGVAATALWLATSGGSRLGAGIAPLRAGIRPRHDSPLVRIVRGLLLALPLLLVFGLLFAAADAVFAVYLQEVVGVEVAWDEIAARVVVGALSGWLFAGTMIAGWMLDPAAPTVDTEAPTPIRPRLGTTEAVVVLLALDAIFGLFVALQAAYLFGGLDTLAVSGMTYAEYARRGFIELIAVAVLAGAVVLGLDALVERRSWAFRAAASVLAVLTGVVLASAVVRLGLYQAAYGWTELRFYALAAICWLAIGLVSTVAGVLAGRAAWVPRVMVGAGLAVALAVNAIGPQAFVADQNLARAIDPRLVPADGESGLDTYYLGSLGDDVVPLLVDAAPRLPDRERNEVVALLHRRATRLAADQQRLGWPSWSLARERAREALRSAGY